ncbi:MAG: hypothetical protein LC650_05160, partial [Actinobacteria bacterium]|nr:hypothetical protein [Actinomycetota bacterium]
VTALIGLGPENDDETPREEVYIESDSALSRWGREGKHLVEVFEPQSEDQNISPEKLQELTQEELNRRISHQSEYLATIATLAEALDVDPNDLQFGDIIRVKDEEFYPPIYLEARIHTMKESVKAYGDSQVTLGDFTEFSESEVKSILNRLKEQIASKVSDAQLSEALENIETAQKITQSTPPEDTSVIWVDNSDRPLITKVYIDAVEGWVPVMPSTAEEIGADPAGSADAALALARDDIFEVSNDLDTLRGEYDDFMSDGFITRSEALSIERHIASLNSEKSDVDADYTATYNNTKLETIDKATLADAKTAYNSAHTNLITVINDSIADGYVYESEVTAVDNAFTTYATALGDYSTARANAGHAITAKEASDAGDLAEANAEATAQSLSNAAQAAAEFYTQEQTALAKLEATIYADGLVTTEEKARLKEAQDKLAEAKAFAEDKAQEAVEAIDNSDLATKEELAQEAEEIRQQLSTRGGANMLRNSIGYSDIDFWSHTTSNQAVTTIMNEALSTLGYGCGFYFPPDGVGKGIQQVVRVNESETYTLGWYVQKAAEGSFDIEILALRTKRL